MARMDFKWVGAIPIEQVEGRIDHMAADLDGRQPFVVALGSDMVEEIDTRQRTVVGNIRGIQAPQGLGYIPKSNSLVVASGGDGDVRICLQCQAVLTASAVKTAPPRAAEKVWGRSDGTLPTSGFHVV